MKMGQDSKKGTIELEFDLSKPLGISLASSSKPGGEGEVVTVVGVKDNGQGEDMGIRLGWELTSIGDQVLDSKIRGADKLALVNSVFMARRSEMGMDPEDQYLAVEFKTTLEDIHTQDFDTKAVAEGIESKIFSQQEYDGIEELFEDERTDHEMALAEAFAGYHPPNDTASVSTQGAVSEKDVLAKINELHRALLITRDENKRLSAHIQTVKKSHISAKSIWRDREKIANKELQQLRHLVGLPSKGFSKVVSNSKAASPKKQAWSSAVAKNSFRKGGGTPYDSMANTQKLAMKPKVDCSHERLRRRKEYQPPRNNTRTKTSASKKLPQQSITLPFSPKISSKSHRFTQKTRTGIIRIPARLLALPVFDEDFPRPVFSINLPDLVRRKEDYDMNNFQSKR